MPTPTLAAREDGFLLIEVIISSLLVALIVIGTFNGFDAVNRDSADQRSHNQAILLAEQSQEQLRTDPVSTLDLLENTPHTYSTTIDGTEYKITQEASPSNGSAEGTGCNVSETTKQSGANVQLTTNVTWAKLESAKLAEGKTRPKVTLSAIITPPSGSGLEIDAVTSEASTVGVPGVTAAITYIASGSGSSVTAEGTTNSNGCFVFGSLPTTSAKVAIDEKSGYVTQSGLLKYPTKEVTIAPNITKHDTVYYDRGGAIKATFTYKGATTWEGKEVTGDTFVVVPDGELMKEGSEFEVGSTSPFTYESSGERRYTAQTGSYKATAETAANSVAYPKGDLFPFPVPWAVYAGDCRANEPRKYVSTLASGKAVVLPAETVEASAPISKINLSV